MKNKPPLKLPNTALFMAGVKWVFFFFSYNKCLSWECEIQTEIHFIKKKPGQYHLEGPIFQIVMEPQQTLPHNESQSIDDCLDDKIEQELIQSNIHNFRWFGNLPTST